MALTFVRRKGSARSSFYFRLFSFSAFVVLVALSKYKVNLPVVVDHAGDRTGQAEMLVFAQIGRLKSWEVYHICTLLHIVVIHKSLDAHNNTNGISCTLVLVTMTIGSDNRHENN